MVNAEEQVKLLVELQKLDSQILKMEDELNSIPEKLSKFENDLNEKSANLKKHEDNAKALHLKRKEKEVELQTKEDTIKKYTTQMYQVKTNKEYTALQEEIARVKADNSLIEEAILKIFDQVDAENREVASQKEFLKKEEAAMREEKKKLDADSVRIKSDLGALKSQRAELGLKVDQKILVRYDRILANRGGLAVVPIIGESCQGCFAHIPAQIINEVRMKNSIIGCDGCTRILYLEE
ncbi:MAG: C4-type zinc ribbon domain-containing protein [Candidatus Omnitrophota bacterium]